MLLILARIFTARVLTVCISFNLPQTINTHLTFDNCSNSMNKSHHFSNFDFSPPAQQFHAVLLIRDYLYGLCLPCVNSLKFTTHIFLMPTFPLLPNNFMQFFICDYLYGLCLPCVHSLQFTTHLFFPICFLTCNSSQSSLFWQSSLRPLCLPCVHTPKFTTPNLFHQFFSYLRFHADLFILHLCLRLVSALHVLPSLYHTRFCSLQFFPICLFLPAISCGPLCSCIHLYGVCLPRVHSFQFTTHNFSSPIFFLFFSVPVISCGPLCFCVYLCGLCLLCVHFLQFFARVRQSGQRLFAHSESCTSARNLRLYVCIYMFICMYMYIFMRT